MGSSRRRRVQTHPLALLTTTAVLCGLALAGCPGPAPVTRTGRVVGPDGVPLAGVTVSAEDGSAVSGPDGRWSLATGVEQLAYRKPGYTPVSVPAAQQSARLEPTGKPIRVAWDDRWKSPATDGIRKWLGTQGVNVQAVGSGQRLPQAEVVVVWSPAYSSYEALSELHAATRRGATLLLAGEWGGYPGVDLATLNELSAPAGIRFDGSLVRDPASLPDLDHFVPTFTVSALTPQTPAEFAGSGALSAVPPAVILGNSGAATYRVSNWSHGPQIVAAYGPEGAGKVVAVADSSWLTDSKTLVPDKPNWQAGGNAALALALVRF